MTKASKPCCSPQTTGKATNIATASLKPEIADDKLIFYVKESTPTSGANVVKPLMLVESLGLPHQIVIVPSTKHATWFHDINPQKMVPAMQGVEVRDGQRLDIWESTSCLFYLVDAYDAEGRWGGKDLWERTQVRNWVEMHSAGLGPAAKNWLTFKKYAEDQADCQDLDVAVSLLKDQIQTQYTVLNKRLSKSGYKFIALPDRETIADFVNLPFANTKVAAMAGIDLAEYPKLKQWSEDMMRLGAVERAWDRVGEFKLGD